jgi:hypothetical protein
VGGLGQLGVGCPVRGEEWGALEHGDNTGRATSPASRAESKAEASAVNETVRCGEGILVSGTGWEGGGHSPSPQSSPARRGGPLAPARRNAATTNSLTTNDSLGKLLRKLFGFFDETAQISSRSF